MGFFHTVSLSNPEVIASPAEAHAQIPRESRTNSAWFREGRWLPLTLGRKRMTGPPGGCGRKREAPGDRETRGPG